MMATALLHNRRIVTSEKNEDLPDFDYTGTCSVVDDGSAGWRIRFLTGGTFTLKASDRVVDIFAVGGGGNGAAYGTMGGGGGGGGKTKMVTGIPLTAGTGYVVTVGGSRGTSKFSDLLSASPGSSGSSGKGGAGGSGGGAGYPTSSPYKAGNGGSDGNAGGSTTQAGGSGQGTTTREFHETSGRLYAGGGGGGSRTSGTPGSGGSGGGGAGSVGAAAKNGTTNYGGGGGGNTSSGTAGSGGSGIVVIRNARG